MSKRRLTTVVTELREKLYLRVVTRDGRILDYRLTDEERKLLGQLFYEMGYVFCRESQF